MSRSGFMPIIRERDWWLQNRKGVFTLFSQVRRRF
jgi:hypothetical protein